MLKFTWKPFNELSLSELYAILALRSQVFVVEQRCHYLDADGADEAAIHLLGQEDNKLCAYLRLFPPQSPTDPVIFGRVLTGKSVRGAGAGKKMLTEMIRYCAENYPQSAIKCSAQYYLLKFYESFGFTTLGEPYDDVGIKHITMVRKPTA